MTHTYDLFDAGLFEQRVNEGYVRVVKHAYADLWIANYTPKAQYERVWDEVTLQCRGLIYDENSKVIARPFRKFFNWDEGGAEIPSGPMIVSPKMDGSLGILYGSGLDAEIASRGSFSSEQAVKGTELFWRDGWNFAAREGKTYLFEILYPQNRIVVDYGDWEGLVLLDVIDNETGARDMDAFDEANWPHKVEHKVYPGFTDRLIHEIADDEEGFVLYFPRDDYRLKMKGARYVHLHRILTGTSSTTIWEHLSRGYPLDDLLENVPDEFYDWVQQTRADLMREYMTIFADANARYNEIRHLHMDRKAFAAEAKKYHFPHLLFRLFDNKSVNEDIWKLVKPERTLPFWAETTSDVSTPEHAA